jgi:hypothetical protein
MSETELSRRIATIRELWCEWDPIGVFSIDPNWPRDEYEGYIEPTLHLLEASVGEAELTQYLERVAHQHMGLSEVCPSASDFAKRLILWFSEAKARADRSAG